MRLTSLSLTLLISGPVLPAKPAAVPPSEPPAAAVEVSARTLYLPPLPANAKDAHKRYPELKTSMEGQLQDLEKDLIHLYSQPGACDAFLGRIQVPKDRKEETQFLVSILRDLNYEAMEKGIVENWQTWQQLFVENGFGQFTDRSENLKVMPDQSPEAIRYNVQTRGSGDWSDWNTGSFMGTNNASYSYNLNPTEKERQIDRELRALAPPPTAISSGTADPMSARANSEGLAYGPYSFNDAETSFLMELNFRYRNGVATIDWENAFRMKMAMDITQSRINIAIVGTRIANREIPALGKAWDPLAEYLNGIAHKLMEYERLAPVGESPELKKLRMLTKIVFLERFRSALWFDNLVWSEVTTDKLPPILRDLRPRSAEYQESAIPAAVRFNGNWTCHLPEAPESFHLASNQLRPLRPAPRFSVLPLPLQIGHETHPWPGVEGFVKTRLLPDSDPHLVSALRRASQDSQELEAVLKSLWQEQPKIRLSLQKIPRRPLTRVDALPSMGSLLVQPVPGGFRVVVLVQTGLADQGMDQVEPWVGQALYALLATSRQDGVTPSKGGFLFNQTTQSSMWDFQRQMRQTLKAEHPEEYDLMALDGQDGFESVLH